MMNLSTNACLTMLMTRLESCSMLSVPRKKPKWNRISPYRKRKCFWFWFWFINQQDSLTNMFADVKKHKLCTLLECRGSDLSVKTVKAVESKINGIDNDICKSHIKERECNEARAVSERGPKICL